jgi:hypothetical protein
MSMSITARWVACATAAFTLVALAAPASAQPAAGAEPTTTYIVTLKPGATLHVAAEATSQLSASGAAAVTPTRVYTNALQGYAAPMTAGQAAAVAADPQVASIEPDGVVTVAATEQNAP